MHESKYLLKEEILIQLKFEKKKICNDTIKDI